MKPINCCDGIYNSIDVHFTSLCDNKCAHCVDNCYAGLGISKPDAQAITSTIIETAKTKRIDDVLFLGGEPCLFLDELIWCTKELKKHTDLKVYVTTSVPKICYDNREKFEELIELLDGLNIPAQHYREDVADEIRNTKSKFDRQAFYNSLPHKEKIRVNLNIVKPYLYTKDDIVSCLKHYDAMGFDSIKLSEIQHGAEYFVSFEKTFGIKLGSPFSRGCQTYLDLDALGIIPGFRTRFLLKRSCFLCEETLKANMADFLKLVHRLFVVPKNNYGVVYEHGELKSGWV